MKAPKAIWGGLPYRCLRRFCVILIPPVPHGTAYDVLRLPNSPMSELGSFPSRVLRLAECDCFLDAETLTNAQPSTKEVDCMAQCIQILDHSSLPPRLVYVESDLWSSSHCREILLSKVFLLVLSLIS